MKTASGQRQHTSLRLSPEPGYVLLVLTALARDRWKDDPPAAAGVGPGVLEGIFLFAEDNNVKPETLLTWLKSRGIRRPMRRRPPRP